MCNKKSLKTAHILWHYNESHFLQQQKYFLINPYSLYRCHAYLFCYLELFEFAAFK